MFIKAHFTVVADAEVKTTSGGKKFATCRIAYNERTKDADGNWSRLLWEDAKNEYDQIGEYADITVFDGSEGDMLALVSGLKKGDFIEVEGRRALRGYVNREGNRVVAANIKPSSLRVVSSKSAKDATAAAPSSSNVGDIDDLAASLI